MARVLQNLSHLVCVETWGVLASMWVCGGGSQSTCA
jgi:hypothetical protein